MSQEKVYSTHPNFKSNLSQEQYQAMYQASIENPKDFWDEQARQELNWMQPWHTTNNSDFTQAKAEWFDGGVLNVSANCIDRHIPTRAQQTAIIWEGDTPHDDLHISYQTLLDKVSQLANALKSRGVNKGDRVCIYMPMIPEAAYAMLACSRIGAVHSVVFGGFSPEALKDRIIDADCNTVITSDEGLRGGKSIPLKANVDKAIVACPNISTVLVVKRTGKPVNWNEDIDVWYHQLTESMSNYCEPEPMKAEDPLFILYTSGSTGTPKGVLHSTAGYLLQSALTHKYVLNYQEGDVYWCTADVGWITGHSYIIYGPLCNGATTLMFEGIPTYPSPARCWDIIDKHQVNTFYTAPTAIRALMAAGDDHLTTSHRSSLKLLGTVGEPINPEAWEWYYHTVGKSACPIVDTWWQTETGAIMIAPIPGTVSMKPGAATLPFFGVTPVILDTEGNELSGSASGNLAIKSSWPSQIRSVYGDHQRYIDTYFSAYPGYYFTGDGARRDEDGFYWITGRVDDVLNVSGHRLGTAEIESALVLHPIIAEAAVVGYPHDIKGQAVYAYITPMEGETITDETKKELLSLIIQEIGAIAKPDKLQSSLGLPKTRSGKIMRRILRKIAANELDNLGDTSTLADPSVVDDLIQNRLNT